MVDNSEVIDGEIEDNEEVIVDAEAQAYEERARRMGWRPKDEYNGPAERWVDAKAFVERGEHELPILRERLRKFDDRLVSTERELTGTRTELRGARGKIDEQSEVITQLRDLALSAEKRSYAKAQSELGERERRAVQESDVPAYDAIQREKRRLEETAPLVVPAAPVRKVEEPPPGNGQQPPQVPLEDTVTISQWIADNPWYNQDPELQAMATSIHGVFKQRSPNQPLSDNLSEVKNWIVTRYPEKFGKTRKGPAAVLAGGAPPPRSNKKGVNDLPPEAKAALSKFKAQIPGYKDEEYLAVYFGSEA